MFLYHHSLEYMFSNISFAKAIKHVDPYDYIIYFVLQKFHSPEEIFSERASAVTISSIVIEGSYQERRWQFLRNGIAC